MKPLTMFIEETLEKTRSNFKQVIQEPQGPDRKNSVRRFIRN